MHSIFHHSQVKSLHRTCMLSLETLGINKQLINIAQIKSSDELPNIYTWADLF